MLLLFRVFGNLFGNLRIFGRKEPVVVTRYQVLLAYGLASAFGFMGEGTLLKRKWRRLQVWILTFI